MKIELIKEETFHNDVCYFITIDGKRVEGGLCKTRYEAESLYKKLLINPYYTEKKIEILNSQDIELPLSK